MTEPLSPEGATRQSRLVLLVVCAAIFLETLQFSILAPVLPVLAAEFGLTDLSAGVVNSAYALGLVVFAIPGGRVAARVDERIAVGVGLAIIGVATAWFSIAGVPWQLGAARFVAGAASALVWAGGMAWVSSTGPRSTQATRLAMVISSAIIGSLVGPALGTLSTVVGRLPVFLAIAVVAWVLIVPIWRLGETHSTVVTSEKGLRRLLGSARVALGVTFFIGVFFAVFCVLVPLEAVSLGASATVVGFAFIVGSLGQALLSPLIGRLTDSRGAIRVMSAALGASAIVTLGLVVAPGALGPVVVLAVLFPVGGAVYTPTSVAVDHAAHRLALAPAIAFSAWNLLWALGVAIGSVAGPAVAGFTGNSAVYIVLAVVSAGLAFVCWRSRSSDSPSTS